MAIKTLGELKTLFGPGQRLLSASFVDLIDTLGDDRTAVHIGFSEPLDESSTPIWFNDSTQVLSVYDGVSWVAAGGGGGGASKVGGGVASAGGGNGGINSAGSPGVANTGGGGGGGADGANSSTTFNGGNGGSGIVIVRYPITDPN